MAKSFKEVLMAIVPMTLLILILSFIFAPLEMQELLIFLLSAVMMILGMTLFLFGAEHSMMAVGDLVGKFMIKKRNLPLMVCLGFIIGIVITIAEPSVQVLGAQVFDISEGNISRLLLIGVVSVGTGIFLALALLRVVFKWSYYRLMLLGYFVTILASFFTTPEFMPIAFDSGGVTTGPITVPFILSVAVGVTSMVHHDKNNNDSFGMVGVASLGPILAVMILGAIFQ